MTSKLRRVGSHFRHDVVGRLPRPVRDAVSARPLPGTRRFTVPLPEGGSLRLASAGAHQMLSRLYWEGPASYEPLTVKTWWCLSQDADAVADVGACFGYYALLASKASPTSTIHAFEPLTEAAQLIRTLTRSNGVENRIRLHETALGSRIGRTAFYLPARPPNLIPSIGSTIDRSAAGEPPAHEERIRRTVEVTTLDAVLAPEGRRLDLMKIDAEGSELDVLMGAERTIEASHPDIVMEIILDGNEPPEALSWLTRHHYRTFDLTPEGPTPVDANGLEDSRNLRRSAKHRYGEVLASRKSDRAIATLCERIAALRWP